MAMAGSMLSSAKTATLLTLSMLESAAVVHAMAMSGSMLSSAKTATYSPLVCWNQQLLSMLWQWLDPCYHQAGVPLCCQSP